MKNKEPTEVDKQVKKQKENLDKWEEYEYLQDEYEDEIFYDERERRHYGKHRSYDYWFVIKCYKLENTIPPLY